MALSLGRRSFIDVLSGGQGGIGAAMLPPPERLWGMPPDRLTALPGYDSDVQKNRAEARKIMQHLGYGSDNPAGGQSGSPKHSAVPIGVEGVGEAPRQHCAAHPVHHGGLLLY